MGRLPEGMGLGYTLSLPFLIVLSQFFFWNFNCKSSFLLVFKTFSSTAVILVYPWNQVSSESSYLAFWPLPIPFLLPLWLSW